MNNGVIDAEGVVCLHNMWTYINTSFSDAIDDAGDTCRHVSIVQDKEDMEHGRRPGIVHPYMSDCERQYSNAYYRAQTSERHVLISSGHNPMHPLP